ncbi:MAG: GWxTD domain-containing protein [Ignavibacteriales bacterium]|nr:GWxTD domain-containing protein [Ignavibacteriales bacterium]
MKSNYFIILICFILINVQLSVAQPEMGSQEPLEIPRFFMDALTLKATESGVTRLDVYVEVPYEAMQFIKMGDVFQSEYEVTVDIFDTTETLVTEKWWTEKIEVSEYSSTVSPVTSNLNQRSFLLTPGSYFLTVLVKDKESVQASRIKRKVIVPKYDDETFLLSDILIADRIESDSGKISVFPNIAGNVGGGSDTFHILYEAYNTVGNDSVKIFSTVFNMKGDTVQTDSSTQKLGLKKHSIIGIIKTKELVAGDYKLKIMAKYEKLNPDGSKSEQTAERSRLFMVRWRGMPVSITDLDLAIDQLEYIADKDLIEEMRKAAKERKKTLFQEFWKKKDPTPNSERNELMEEYYTRVTYANKHFGNYTEGWKSDMGMVYIIFGPPSNIERHPFDIDSKPYEIWTYYDISREFIFVDVTGFGDYRLQNPLWDLRRTRPR